MIVLPPYLSQSICIANTTSICILISFAYTSIRLSKNVFYARDDEHEKCKTLFFFSALWIHSLFGNQQTMSSEQLSANRKSCSQIHWFGFFPRQLHGIYDAMNRRHNDMRMGSQCAYIVKYNVHHSCSPLLFWYWCLVFSQFIRSTKFTKLTIHRMQNQWCRIACDTFTTMWLENLTKSKHFKHWCTLTPFYFGEYSAIGVLRKIDSTEEWWLYVNWFISLLCVFFFFFFFRFVFASMCCIYVVISIDDHVGSTRQFAVTAGQMSHLPTAQSIFQKETVCNSMNITSTANETIQKSIHDKILLKWQSKFTVETKSAQFGPTKFDRGKIPIWICLCVRSMAKPYVFFVPSPMCLQSNTSDFLRMKWQLHIHATRYTGKCVCDE